MLILDIGFKISYHNICSINYDPYAKVYYSLKQRLCRLGLVRLLFKIFSDHIKKCSSLVLQIASITRSVHIFGTELVSSRTLILYFKTFLTAISLWDEIIICINCSYSIEIKSSLRTYHIIVCLNWKLE